MSDREGKWEKLTKITEEYQPDGALPDKAICKINQREATVVYKKPLTKRVIIASAILACVIVLSVFLPIYFSSRSNNPDVPNIPDTPKITIYTDDNIEFENVDDLERFVEENNYDCVFFKDEFVKSQCAIIKDNSSKAYIVQNTVCFTETGPEKLNLKIVLLENAEFDFYKDFVFLSQTLNVNSIDVEYSVNYINEEAIYRAKFDYNNYSYFLEISTFDGDANKIEEYINKLIK